MIESSRILKWAVPLDDEWHDIPARPGDVKLVIADRVVHGAGRSDEHRLLFWAREEPVTGFIWRYKVVGTGHTFPGNAVHAGSAQDGIFFWHLIARDF